MVSGEMRWISRRRTKTRQRKFTRFRKPYYESLHGDIKFSLQLQNGADAESISRMAGERSQGHQKFCCGDIAKCFQLPLIPH